MERKEYDEVVQLLREKIDYIRSTKGVTYARDEDQFMNFKRMSKQTGLCPYQVWGVYFTKHVDAIHSFVRNEYNDTEPIEGRIMDAINYLELLYGMIKEGEVRKDE